MCTYASIIPLIGGMSLASEKVIGKKPEYVLSYSLFQHNDSHYIRYIRNQGWNGKYYVLDKNPESVIPDITTDFEASDIPYVDIVNGTPPCAGLSGLSSKSGSDSATNDWMINATEFVLGTIKPKVYWFENAPRFSTAVGRPVANKVYKICENYGYTLLLFSTESRFHENCQIRPRTFVFCFKKDVFGESVHYFDDIPHRFKNYEDMIKEANELTEKFGKTDMDLPINPKHPLEVPFYCYCYNLLKPESHQEFVKTLCTDYNKPVKLKLYAIESANYNFEILSNWFSERGFKSTAKHMLECRKNLDSGRGLYIHSETVARGVIPSFVGSLPVYLLHPTEQRFITFREGFHLMGFPHDFSIVADKPARYANHICQNVPVNTAADMAREILKLIEDPSKNILDDITFAIQRNRQGDIVPIIKNNSNKINNLFE